MPIRSYKFSSIKCFQIERSFKETIRYREDRFVLRRSIHCFSIFIWTSLMGSLEALGHWNRTISHRSDLVFFAVFWSFMYHKMCLTASGSSLLLQIHARLKWSSQWSSSWSCRFIRCILSLHDLRQYLARLGLCQLWPLTQFFQSRFSGT